MIPAKIEFNADLLLYILKNEPEVQLYFGILSSFNKKMPFKGEEDKVFTTEISDPSYIRQPVSFVKFQDDFVKLTSTIRFPRSSKKWERVTHFGIFDAAKNGNMVLLKPTGSITSIEPGEITTILETDFCLYVGHNLIFS